MNAKVTTTKVTQTANAELGKEETNLYYIIIETATGKDIINVGQKRYEAIKKLIENGKPVEKQGNKMEDKK